MSNLNAKLETREKVKIKSSLVDEIAGINTIYHEMAILDPKPSGKIALEFVLLDKV